ncbi:MAG: type I polyketide synthase [Cyanobacteria bacterium P01_F01_bin.143]
MDSIAIIGLDCRFPGAKDPESFWNLLKNGVDAIAPIPESRWDLNAFYDPEPATPGKMYTRYGGFLDEVDKFDPHFFGISPREAHQIDPQQRLLLEVSWGALENAGVVPASLARSKTGVFVGITDNDYRYLYPDVSSLDTHSATGQKLCIAANRLSYILDLCGPNLAIDTGCSSSLVALHLACQSLLSKESELCLVGGVNLVLIPGGNISLCQMKMMAIDGRCKTFDASADGYVRSDGCGVVVLKRLKDALQDGDTIQAVIRGSAVNQDGLTNGLTAPNGPSQQAVIRQALATAGVQPSQISYVEAHGTGTALGDPIEVRSLKEVLIEGRSQEQTCWIGSVKTNIGHTEAAAGIAGLIKVILSLQHQQIPPHLHFKELNPYIKLDNAPLEIPTQLQSWTTETKLAGVSSFGFGGTNAHVILEEAGARSRGAREQRGKGAEGAIFQKRSHRNSLRGAQHILTLSAKTETALQDLVRRYQNYLTNNPELDVADICFSANTGRSHFEHRLAVVTESSEELQQKLEAFETGREVFGLVTGQIIRKRTRKIAFLFTGQGSQYLEMGQELYQTQPLFRQTLEKCQEILTPYLEIPLLEIIYPNSDSKSSLIIGNRSLITDDCSLITDHAQPVIFALEYALATLWQSWGIEPDIVTGHSVGEYVAACVAGVFSLEDGLKLIAYRGRLMQALPAGGKMLAVLATETQIQQVIAPYAEQVNIAAINGPDSIVISGVGSAIATINQTLEAEGIKTKFLQVSHAFHSTLMEPMLEEFAQIASQISYYQPKIPLVSNVTGEIITEEIATAEYWVRHVREPVRFADSMQVLAEQGCNIFLEIGSKPILLGMGRQIIPDNSESWLPSLRPQEDDWQQILISLGQLYVQGIDIDWASFSQNFRGNKITLPTYPFERERYWIEKTSNQQQKATSEINNSPILDLINKGDQKGIAEVLQLTEKFTAEEQELLPKVLDILINKHQDYLQFKGNVVYDYYNSVTSISEEQLAEKQKSLQFLTFGIFPEEVSGFSWLKLFTEQTEENFAQLAVESQEELRELCFNQVDFSSCKKVLDFGCGYSSDLITLAQKHPHLKLTGYTISAEQARFGNSKVNKFQLQEKIQVFNRDSSQDDFPDNYDLMFGFEVAHHIKGKTALFSNIGQHLEDQGLLVLADFIANTDFNIDHEETSSYFINQSEWVEHLSQNHLQLIGVIDVSQEIANFLYDPNFEQTLNKLYQRNPDDNVRAGFQSYNQLGGLLRKGLTSYVLFTAQKQESLAKEELAELNRNHLSQLTTYSEVAAKQWIYELEWQPKANQQQNLIHQNKSGTWLIFAHQNSISQELTIALAEQNKDYIIIYPGTGYKQLNAQNYQVDPTNKENFFKLFQELSDKKVDLQGIVHLWGLNTLIEELATAQELGSASVLYLVQALVTQPELTIPLYLVTQGSQNLANQTEILQIQQAPLWGLGRVIALEHPELQCRCIDLDANSSSVTNLVQEILYSDEENQIAYRQDARYVARLVRQKSRILETQKAIAVQSEASYLITGGLGALGLKTAQWMVEQGAKKIVLMGRKEPSLQATEIIKDLKQKGAEILVCLGDISVAKDVTRVLGEIQQSLPELKGIIHAAGVVDDNVLTQMSWEQFKKVMNPKVLGSWNLHQSTQNLDLDFFVCFSSISSLIGSPGQGNYAAANAFMDALACDRRNQGLPGLSINWGIWGEAGMAARLENQHQTRWQTTGINAIPPEKGLELLGQLLSAEASQLGVFSVNWNQFVEQLTKAVKMPLLAKFVSQKSAATQNNEFIQELTAATEREREQLLTDYIQIQIGKLLGFSKTKIPDKNMGFFEMGMDSLTAVELRNILHSNLGSTISAATLFDVSNIEDLANYLIAEMFTQDLESAPEAESPPEKEFAYAQVEPQSEGEITDAIAAELTEIQNLLQEDY